jgi:hypothetical protein
MSLKWTCCCRVNPVVNCPQLHKFAACTSGKMLIALPDRFLAMMHPCTPGSWHWVPPAL